MDTPRIPDDVVEILVNPAAYADARIHEAYTWLRANRPLSVAEPKGYDPFWVVTRHADILEISRQNDLFHSGDKLVTLQSRDLGGKRRDPAPSPVRSLVQMDAPDHPKYRMLTQSWFMPPNLRTIEDRIRTIARTTVDKMATKGGACDFVADVALHYPLHIIMEILGVPEEDEPRMLKLTQEIFGQTDPETAREKQMDDPAKIVAATAAVMADFYAYFSKISTDRRANPQDDLASVIANSRIDGELLSDAEAMGYYVIVATAGHDTTSSSTAGAVWALAENPAQLAMVQADPSLIPSMIEEAIRWTTPVKHFMRTATQDVELGGQLIRKGDWLMLCYASGNRDEAVFEDPFVFQADRKPNRHLSFGYGAHLCLGQHLARMEMRILFEELLPRLKSLKLAGQPKMTQAIFVNGPKTLPIEFTLAA